MTGTTIDAAWGGREPATATATSAPTRLPSASRPVRTRKPGRVCIDGNEAAARVAHRLSEVIAIYPITPASPMAELADAWNARQQRNLWGQVRGGRDAERGRRRGHAARRGDGGDAGDLVHRLAGPAADAAQHAASSPAS